MEDYEGSGSEPFRGSKMLASTRKTQHEVRKNMALLGVHLIQVNHLSRSQNRLTLLYGSRSNLAGLRVIVIRAAVDDQDERT